MASLINLLRKQGYDYIDGPVRNQTLLQVWCKRPTDKIFNYAMLDKLFQSQVSLEKEINPALQINFNKKQSFDIGVGITAFDQVLKSTGIGDLGLESRLKTGKTLSVAYDQAFTEEYSQNNLNNYFFAAGAGFTNENPSLLNDANRNNFILITGILYARNLQVTVNSDIDFDANLGLEISKVAKGKVDASLINSKELLMKADLKKTYPVAVKAFRLHFARGKFKTMNLATDRKIDWY